MTIEPFAPWPEPSDRRGRVVEHLTRTLALDSALVDRAELLAARTARPVEQVLNQMGVVPDDVLARAYAAVCGCEVWTPETGPTPIAPSEAGVQPRFLADRRILPLAAEDTRLRVAMYDPLDDETVAGLAFATGRTIDILAVSPSDYRRAAHALLPEAAESGPISDDPRLEVEAQRVADVGAESEAARLLTLVLEAAVARQASDIHLEPRRHDFRIRLRIDGQLTDLRTASAEVAGAVVARVKVMANLDLGERRLPQDGRATFVVEGRSIETRVSLVPTVFGETAVLRILDRVGLAFDLSALGVSEPEVKLLRSAVGASHGIFLVCGPTGSGKTTTLYALINGLADARKKILSVEDPVEHHFAHVNQVQVAPAIDLTFATALRAFLRQDPDVILVGEVRDRETAAVAVQAAMTGHLVLASVHTNDAVRVVPRLLDMGIEPYQLAASLIGAAAQRLVRRLCPHCRVQRPPTIAEAAFLQSQAQAQEPERRIWASVGCEACGGSGFRGRVALVEGFLSTEGFAAGVVRRDPVSVLTILAGEGGLRPLVADGLAKARAGLTTHSEVMSVMAP